MPRLPQFFQVGANSGNAIGRATSELEAACQIAAQLQLGSTLEAAINQVASGEVACRASLASIGHYVSRYSGGPGAPLLKFLSQFGQTFGCTLMLGQEFTETLAHMSFQEATNLFPFTRTAIWATQLTASKSSDGFSKMVTKSDLQTLCSPKALDQAKAAESLLADCWQVVQSQLPPATAENHKKTVHLYRCFGKLCFRTTLFQLKKQKLAPDELTFQTLPEILDRFTKELQGLTTTPATGSRAATIEDAVKAEPFQAMLLQNTHIKVGGMNQGCNLSKCSSCISPPFGVCNICVPVLCQGTAFRRSMGPRSSSCCR